MERTKVVGDSVEPKAWLVVVDGAREGRTVGLGRFSGLAQLSA